MASDADISYNRKTPKVALGNSPKTVRAINEVKTVSDLSDSEFSRLAKRIYMLSGIILPDFKRQLVFRRVRKRLNALGHSSFGEYLDYLDSAAGAQEARELVNAITTNLTSFFRESHHFDDLATYISNLDLVQDPGRKIRIWSAACSTGEEPYSIAMTAQKTGNISARTDFKILATDLDTEVLGRAGGGYYSFESIKNCPKFFVNSYFRQSEDQKFHVEESTRNLIRFSQLNLHENWPMRGPFDAIFCRNVLIYFDAKSKLSIVDRMVKLLRAGGKLYLGHSESLCGHHPDLTSQGQTIYQKVR